MASLPAEPSPATEASYGQRVLEELDRLQLGANLSRKMRQELPGMSETAVRRHLQLPFPFNRKAIAAEPEELVHLTIAARFRALRVLLFWFAVQTFFLVLALVL